MAVGASPLEDAAGRTAAALLVREQGSRLFDGGLLFPLLVENSRDLRTDRECKLPDNNSYVGTA